MAIRCRVRRLRARRNGDARFGEGSRDFGEGGIDRGDCLLANERILSRAARHFESVLRLSCKRARDLRPLDDGNWSKRGGRSDRRWRQVRFLACRRNGGGRSRCDRMIALGGELWLPSTTRPERDGLRSDLQRLRPGADRLRKARRDRARVVLRALDRIC